MRISDWSSDVCSSDLKTLAKAGVPYATGAVGLLGRPECVLALACLRRLHDPGDTIATAEILSLADCAAPEQWLADRLEHLAQNLPKAEWREVGEGAHPLLARVAVLRQELQQIGGASCRARECQYA